MLIRIAQESDLPELVTLFRQTILMNAPQHYTPEQTEAWASSALDLEHFRHFIFCGTTYLVVGETGILGFAGIEETGHVLSVYVRHDCLHQGIGSALMQVLLDHADRHKMQRLYAEASEFSLGLFKKFGFRLYDTEIVDRQGVRFERYLVEKLRSV